MIAFALSLALELSPPEPPPSSEAIAEQPSSEQPSSEPQQPQAGGFGNVTSVTTDSKVVAPPPTVDAQAEQEQEGPNREVSLRIQIGYGQVDLGSVEGLDHQGASLRAHVALYPWVSKERRVGFGLGLAVGYQGMNRKRLPADAGLERSKGQQQTVLVSVPLLFRPHVEWFSIQPSGLFGFAFFSQKPLWTANRSATLSSNKVVLVGGGELALCTAWDIVCVVGGSEYFSGVLTVAEDTSNTRAAAQVINPWGWYVGLGFDMLRVIQRGNRTST